MGWLISLYLLIFILGSCVFSFLNVIIYRLPKDESFVKGRSYCPACGHTLGVFDLIPIISFLFLRGKCRYCGSKFGVKDSITELFGGLLASFCIYFYDFNPIKAVLLFAFYCVLYVVAGIDHDTMEIPDGCHIAILMLAIASYFVFDEISLVSRLIGCLCVSLPMLLISMLLSGAFGGGDIKLMFACGLFLGYKLTLISAALAFLIGGCYALILLIRKRAGKKDRLAFGPFLVIGMMLGWPYGAAIWNWYLSVFGF